MKAFHTNCGFFHRWDEDNGDVVYVLPRLTVKVSMNQFGAPQDSSFLAALEAVFQEQAQKHKLSNGRPAIEVVEEMLENWKKS